VQKKRSRKCALALVLLRWGSFGLSERKTKELFSSCRAGKCSYNAFLGFEGTVFMEVGGFVMWAGGGLLGGFLAVVAWKIITDEIDLSGLLNTRDSSGRLTPSPAQQQMLMISLLVAARYISDVIHHPSSSLPSPSPKMLYLLGGSHAFHVGRKAFTQVIQPLLAGLNRSEGQK
jgi:hypothetical protein